MRNSIPLKSATVVWLGGGNIFLSYCMYMGLMMLGRRKYVHTAEPLVLELSAF